MSRIPAAPEAVRTRFGIPIPAALLSGLALLALAVIALAVGKYPVTPTELAGVLGHRFLGLPTRASAAVETVVMQVRLPRVVAALVVGAALSGAGATYQGLFRNPLVSPDILGVSAGAGLGAVLGIYLGLPVAPIQALAFLGGLGAVAAVYGVGLAVRRHDPVLTLVLAGVAVGAVLGAGISLLKVLADPYNQLPAITFWLLGSLSSVTLADVAATLPMMLLGLAPLVLLRWRMNLMSLGDEEARTLGVETRAAASGADRGRDADHGGGRVDDRRDRLDRADRPAHRPRSWSGPDYRRLLPASLLLGAGYLVGGRPDRPDLGTIEVPLGILTALVGAPFFLWLLAAGRRGFA